MEQSVIRAEKVSKVYRLWNSPSARLRYSLLSQALRTLRRALPVNAPLLRQLQDRRAAQGGEFHALRDISLDIQRGESVAIIGRNGSGKSTLLQIIAGTLTPTSGTVEVRGRVAALLELGSGFNAEFSGRENVFLNAALLGLTRAQTEERFDRIAAFADIGAFLDQPVKTYSSGMVVRLAFAVQTAVDPEVLIVDEALSVGDVFFQQKCFRRLHELQAAGTTVLFVSHDLNAVRNLCSRALLLKEGVALFTGAPEEAASRYHALCAGATRWEVDPPASPAAGQASPEAPELEALKRETRTRDLLPTARSRHGSGADRQLELVAAAFWNELDQPSLHVRMLGTCRLQVLLRAVSAVAQPTAGLHLYDRMNTLVFAAGTAQLQTPLPPLAAGEEILLTFRLGLHVQPGEYTFSLGCGEPVQEGPNAGFVHDRHEGLGPIHVHQPTGDIHPFYGVAQLPLEIAPWR